MRDWIDDWVKRLSDQAFTGGDSAVVGACAEWLVAHEPADDAAWSMQMEALFHTRQWFRAWRWAERWQQTTGNVVANYWMARVEVSLQLYRQAEHRLAQTAPASRNAAINEMLTSLQSALPEAQRGNPSLWIASTIDAFLAAQAQDSEACCVCGEALLALNIRENDVLRATGLAHWQNERKEDALRNLSAAKLEADAELAVLTEVYIACGRIDAARQTLLRWQARDHSGRAIALAARCELASGNSVQCASLLLQGIDQFHDCEELWKVMGAWLMYAHEPLAIRDRLRVLTQTALQKNADAWAALALAEVRCGAMIDTALNLYTAAIALRENFALAHKNCGVCHFRSGRYAEARLAFQRALQAQPDYAMAWGELGMTCLKLQDYAEAERSLLTALVLKPNDAGNWNNLGSMLLNCYRYHAAIVALERGLTIDSKNKLLRSNVSNAYVNVGRFADARNQLQRLIDEPLAEDLTSITNLLFTINYDPDLSSEDIIALYRKTISRGFPSQRYTSWPNRVDAKRRLRVAYVSADFCNHPCYHFVQPLLKKHNHEEFCVVGFSNVVLPDEKTSELRGYCDEWHDITRLSPDQLGDFIHQQQIDILVDLSGHTAGNVLPVFALKPSPLQLSWLGFGYSSGLTSMDYFLCDEEMYPVGSESLFTEQAARIPLPCFVYKPSIYAPEVNASPAQKTGTIHFGSLSRPIRLNKRCLHVWAEILHRVENSRLILNCHAFGEKQSVAEMTQFFVERGIDAARLDIASTSPPWPVYQQIDIALDCFPHNSGTTLFEGLLMGVPFITRRDRVSMGRLGATIARGVGHPEWIADSDEDYINRAQALASDIEALAVCRQNLRATLLQSKLCDAADFTHRVESVYRDIWQRWCQRQLETAA